ncbi:hypothetical protein POM88_010240 [Heracleum sosnowskyi]|uniref:Transposase-associated domain-containing protein n=1 Tax=Heracleum sosnowskyi TaxID=360622 RepID=A0AAD8JDD3_9APIA|nr:hypothetical protein POM88_010240 [Heracleum sosnowskyi]
MASDQSWMHHRFDARNNITEEYKLGVQNFISVALRGEVDSKGRIRCPCKECGNSWSKLPDNVTYDLYRYGIMESYTTWIFHGEKHRSRVEAETSSVGASGSGSAGSRVTGNRGGDGRDGNRARSRGRGRGRGQGGRREEMGRGNARDHEENEDEEDCEQEGDSEGEEEGNDEEQIDTTIFGRAPCSICDGDYKKKPMLGQPKLGVVTFINKKNIKEAHYKKTLKAIVRTRWDFDTAKQKGRARETFLNECIEEFKDFYEYPPKFSGDKIKELEGDSVVKKHLKTNLRCYMNGWKTDGLTRVEEARKKGDTRASLLNCPPYYLSEPAWNGLVEYWEIEGFSKMSENGKANVKKAEIKHCSGAKPFDHRYEELEEKSKKPLTVLEKFDVSYKKKGQVEEIARKLKEVVERNAQEGTSQDDTSENAALSPGSQRKREVELLLEVCPPKKGRVIMFPRHTLPELLGIDGASKYTTSKSSSACIPQRIPERAYSIIGKVMTEVTNMVEAIEEIEVTHNRLDQEVQKLATLAYPNRDDPASKILWEEYIRIAAHMTPPLCQRYKKVILEGCVVGVSVESLVDFTMMLVRLQDSRFRWKCTKVHEDEAQMEVHEDDTNAHLHYLEERYPL